MLYGRVLSLQSDRESVTLASVAIVRCLGIVGDPFLANAMEVCSLIFQLYAKEQLDHCLVT